MIITAKLSLVVRIKDKLKKITEHVTKQDEVTVELKSPYKERFEKAESDEIKMKVIQGFLQSPLLNKILTEKEKDSNKLVGWKTVQVTDFKIGEPNEDDDVLDEPKPKTIKKKVTKKREPKKKVAL